MSSVYISTVGIRDLRWKMVAVETEDLVITYLTVLSPDISLVAGFDNNWPDRLRFSYIMCGCIVQHPDDMMTGGKKTMTMTRAAGLGIWSRLPGWRSRPEISGVHFVKPGWCSQPWSHMGLLSITMDGSGQTDQIPDITPLVPTGPHCGVAQVTK